MGLLNKGDADDFGSLGFWNKGMLSCYKFVCKMNASDSEYDLVIKFAM
jgi:hypothetical protein